MRRHKVPLFLVLTVFTLCSFIGFATAVLAQEADAPVPERRITMAVEYPGIELPAGEDVEMDILFNNSGKTAEDVDVWVAEAPEGWTTVIKTYKFTVTGVHVPAEETKTLDFVAEPGEEVQPGHYEFQIEAQTRDRAFKMAQTIAVRVTPEKAREEPKVSEDIALNTSYPVLRGPTDGKFEFTVEVESDLDEDAVFDLFAEAPKGWEINFKPGYESKYITSLQIKANQSKNVSVEVTPFIQAEPGEYPITMRVTAGEARAEIELVVELTGTYKLDAGTPNGLLSLDARQGKTANVSIYVKNTGSAPNTDINFMSFKPENWKVEFTPETIEALEPGELKQVEVAITPYEEALVGDYSVAVEVQGEKASKTLEFRTTVKASAAWGWIGIAIIVVVIVGLTGLFRWLGRR
jgi:uncharacterized membrane protein